MPVRIPYTEYRGYNVSHEAPNVSSVDLPNKANAFGAYGDWDITFYCPPPDALACWSGPDDYSSWIHRAYTVLPSSPAEGWRGRLTDGHQCRAA